MKMRGFFVSIVLPTLSIATMLGCFGSVGSDDSDETRNATSRGAYGCPDDAGCGLGTVHPTSAKVTLDGRSCDVDTVGPGSGLDLGLDGNGWTVAVPSEACGFILNVSGLDDQPYPQSSTTAVLGESRVILFTGESLDGVDGGIGGTYASDPGGSALVNHGPSHGVPANIDGHAHLIGGDGKSVHDVTYSIVF